MKLKTWAGILLKSLCVLGVIGFSALLLMRDRPDLFHREKEISPTATGNPSSAQITQRETPTTEIQSFVILEQTEGIRRKASLKTIIPERPTTTIRKYTVQVGDNLFAIAEKFSIKPETVLWGNYEVLQDNPQFLRPDQELNILPIDGVYYQWHEGDSLAKVASFFKVEPDQILEFSGNELSLTSEGDTIELVIEPGTWLIIPDGRRALRDWGPPAITRANPASAAYYGAGYCGQVYEGAIGTGSFVWPTTAKYISGYSYSPSLHPGIDIGGAEGNAIFASDSGVVVYAGWSEYGYGNLIVLDHGNGWQSAYAHLLSVGVYCGQSVGRGTLIGALGSTGNSTGAHLHFELRSEYYGKVNPLDFIVP